MLRIKAQNASDAIRRAGSARQKLIEEFDKAVDATTKEAINNAKKGAPVRDSLLRNSIDEVRQERKVMSRTFGSDRPYARRQEYEHKTRRGYFRKSLWVARTDLRDAIDRAVRRLKL